MKRLLLAVPLIAMTGAAFAIDVPADVHKDMWCATAFQVFFKDKPVDPAVTYYLGGADFLMQRATAALKTAGVSDPDIAAEQAKVLADVNAQINTPDGKPEFAAEDCASMLPPPPAPPSSESTSVAPDVSSSSAP